MGRYVLVIWGWRQGKFLEIGNKLTKVKSNTRQCFNPLAVVMPAKALSRKEGHVGAVAFSVPVTLPQAISAMPK
jgi:hypothetical protein